MSKTLKWILAVLAAVVVMIVAVVIIASVFINSEEIQHQISKATGRSFTMGGDSKLSFFPWIGVTLHDVHLGNPPGFTEKDMVSADLFEVRVKLLPLFTGNVEVKRFVLKGANLTVIKNKNGRFNFEGMFPGSPGGATKPEKQAPPSSKEEGKKKGALPIKALQVDEFAVRDGALAYIDRGTGVRKDIKQINFSMDKVSLDKPIRLTFSAVADNHPISLNGNIGPLGSPPGKNPVAFNLDLGLAKKMNLGFKGQADISGASPQFTVAVNIPTFSAPDVLAELGQSLPIKTSDPDVLKKIALQLTVSGSPAAVSVQKGLLDLDDTRIQFSAQAKDFARPDLTFTASVDKIDLDRYLPASSGDTATKSPQAQTKTQPIDYGPLRTLVLDGHLKIGELKVKNIHTQNIDIHATAKDGILRADPIRMDLYAGKVQMDGTFNVKGPTPRNAVDLSIANLQSGPLLKDFLNKNLIEGVLNSTLKLKFNGDQPDQIRKTLSGGGELKFNDGAILGIDLANMARNVTSAFGGQKPVEKPRTDFSEFLVPLAIQNGRARIDGTRLNSPLLRVTASGDADVAKETLDLRVVPKFVATLVGQGDTAANRAGLTVPVLITGTFSKPKFAPDLKGMISTAGKQKVEKEVESTKKNITKDLEKKTQELLKGLPFGGGSK